MQPERIRCENGCDFYDSTHHAANRRAATERKGYVLINRGIVYRQAVHGPTGRVRQSVYRGGETLKHRGFRKGGRPAYRAIGAVIDDWKAWLADLLEGFARRAPALAVQLAVAAIQVAT